MRKNNIHYTRYAFEKHGKLFKQTIYKKNIGVIPRKADLDTEKYGGYIEPSVTYFLLVRYVLEGNKAKSELMLLPVTLLEKFRIKNNHISEMECIKWSVSRFIGKDISMIREITYPIGLRHIKINTVFEIDGFRVCIAGKSGNDVILKSSMPLILSKEKEQYIKKLEKFSIKYSKNDNINIDTNYDDISCEKNIELYKLLIDKFVSNPYKRIDSLNKYKDLMVKNQETFVSLSLVEQTIVLLSILSIFQFGKATEFKYDITLLGGEKSLPKIRKSIKLSNWKKSLKEVRLLDMSSSGLYVSKSPNLLEFL